MSQFKQFYQKSKDERLTILESDTSIDLSLLQHEETIDFSTADTMVENCIGVYGVPLGIVPNVLIDGKLFHAPMATEEPSVIAAANYGVSFIRRHGGFSIVKNERGMIGEIAFDISEYESLPIKENWGNLITQKKEELLTIANQSYPSLTTRGGGAFDIWYDIKKSLNNKATFFIIYLAVDTQEAMGANMLNTMLEALNHHLSHLFNQSSLMSILSNYASLSLVKATCQIPISSLENMSASLSAYQLAKRIESAYLLASADIYRCTTHNKGIMNGISAVVLASGNDTRAIEASVHSFASRSGVYQPLTKWTIHDSILIGEICLPLPIGYVGGSISIHKSAKLMQQISKTSHAKELASLIACVGLAQNFAALRALVTDGIQKGHMHLHIKTLALSIGATSHEIPILQKELMKLPHINQQVAKQVLQNIRQL